MLELIEVIRYLRLGYSIWKIYRETGIHRDIIREIKHIAIQKDWLNPEALLPSEYEMELARKALKPSVKPPHGLDAFKEEIHALVQKGHSIVVIHSLLSGRYKCDESTLRRYIKREFPVIQKPVMVRANIPGEVMEVDFGFLGYAYDTKTNSKRKVWIFSARLRYSKKCYREKVYDQKQETFFQCHIHAFEFFTGVPEKVVCDNLKAAVIKASHYEPLINRAYLDLAKHYDFIVSPCKPYTPNHKGGVENDMAYIKKNFWPLFVEKERQFGRTIPLGDYMQAELEKWNEVVSETRKISGIGRTPIELFREEIFHLKKLPKYRWDILQYKLCKVAKDFRIQFNKAFYSVPYKYIDKEVLVRGDMQNVLIFYGSEQIAIHPKATRSWQYIKNSDHAPPIQEEYLNQNRNGLLLQARRLGKNVHQVMSQIIHDKQYDCLPACRGVLRLAVKYSPERLEKACERAAYYRTFSFQSVKNILMKNLDTLPLDQPNAENTSQLNFRFAREFGFFDVKNLESNHLFKENI